MPRATLLVFVSVLHSSVWIALYGQLCLDGSMEDSVLLCQWSFLGAGYSSVLTMLQLMIQFRLVLQWVGTETRSDLYCSGQVQKHVETYTAVGRYRNTFRRTTAVDLQRAGTETRSDVLLQQTYTAVGRYRITFRPILQCSGQVQKHVQTCYCSVLFRLTTAVGRYRNTFRLTTAVGRYRITQ